MSADVYESDVQQLRITAKKVGGAVDELGAEVRSLRASVDALRVYYTGEASNKLYAGFDEDCLKLEEAVKELNELYEVMKSVCRTDEESEQTLEDLVSSISL